MGGRHARSLARSIYVYIRICSIAHTTSWREHGGTSIHKYEVSITCSIVYKSCLTNHASLPCIVENTTSINHWSSLHHHRHHHHQYSILTAYCYCPYIKNKIHYHHQSRTSPSDFKSYCSPVDTTVNTSFSISTSTSSPVEITSHSRTSVSTGYSSPVDTQFLKKILAYD